MVSLYLIRHAHAGSRSAWEGDDEERPLSTRGRAQSKAIAKDLSSDGIDVLWTSRYVRCRETLEPLAGRLGLKVVDQGLLAEGGWGNDALDALLAEVAAGHTVAACSHGDVIPAIVATATRRGAELDGSRAISKGARYECTVKGGQIRRIVEVPAPEV